MSSPSALAHKQARGDLGPIKRAYRHVHGPDKPFEGGAILGPLEAFLVKHAMDAATRAQAAIHEAAHYVAFEWLGLVAGTAAIHGSTFGRAGWGGEASAWNSLYSIPTLPQDWSPNALLHEAHATLAGPIAEDLLGGGDALSSIGELVGAALFSDRAAELSGRDEVEFWRETLRGAIALVERHAAEILDIGAMLGRRRRISSGQTSVQKILERVRRTPIHAGPVSERGFALARRIDGALRELAQ